MPRMSIRATYALDEQTDQRIRRLARIWGVSQAEVIRRAVQTSAEHAQNTLTPAEVVAHYKVAQPPRSAAATRRAIAALRHMRHADDEQRGGSAQ